MAEQNTTDEPIVSKVADRMVMNDGPEDAMSSEDWQALRNDDVPNPFSGADDDFEKPIDGVLSFAERHGGRR